MNHPPQRPWPPTGHRGQAFSPYPGHLPAPRHDRAPSHERQPGRDAPFTRRHASPYARDLLSNENGRRARGGGRRKQKTRWPRTVAGGQRPKRVWVNARYADSMDLLLDLHTSLGVRRDCPSLEVWENITAAFPVLGKSELTGVVEASDSSRGGLVCTHVKDKAGMAYSPQRKYFVFVLVPPREGEARLRPESLSVPVKSKWAKKARRKGLKVKISEEDPKTFEYELLTDNGVADDYRGSQGPDSMRNGGPGLREGMPGAGGLGWWHGGGMHSPFRQHMGNILRPGPGGPGPGPGPGLGFEFGRQLAFGTPRGMGVGMGLCGPPVDGMMGMGPGMRAGMGMRPGMGMGPAMGPGMAMMGPPVVQPPCW